LGKPYENWKRKEPGSKLSDLAAQNQKKNEEDRALMEKNSRAKFTIHTLFWFKEPKLINSFIVYLNVPLTSEAIQERMMKGFSDI
jgi:hypothetical protein